MTTNAQVQELNIKLASLFTLGFICEDINPECLSIEELNAILFALLSNVDLNNIEITQIAMKAFARAAPITDKNFVIKEQKEYIMN